MDLERANRLSLLDKQHLTNEIDYLTKDLTAEKEKTNTLKAQGIEQEMKIHQLQEKLVEVTMSSQQQYEKKLENEIQRIR
jgi:hypothetical protein